MTEPPINSTHQQHMKPADHKYKILITEDQPITRTLLEDMLQDEYEVVKAVDGRDAVERVKRERDIDLILLDIIMPELNGFEVCEMLKDDPDTRDIPVIILTIMDQAHNEARGFELGVADYISKPVSRTRLLTRVKNQLVIKGQRNLLEEKNLELQAAFDHIRALHGLLPICSHCKQIKDDAGNWRNIEEYIGGHASGEFSHGVCPQCRQKDEEAAAAKG